MAYNALGLPALDTKGPDIVGAFSRGRELQNLATRNALMQEELRAAPEKRQRETERFEHEKSGWDLDKKTKILDFDMKATAYVRESLAGLTGVEEYTQFRQNLVDKGLDVSRFPEAFDNPDQFELFRTKAIKTAREREIELQAKLNEEAAVSGHGRTMEKERYAQGEQNKRSSASLASAERIHSETQEGLDRRYQPDVVQLDDGTYVTKKTAAEKGLKGKPVKVEMDTADKEAFEALKSRYVEEVKALRKLEQPDQVTGKSTDQGRINKQQIAVNDTERKMTAILDKYYKRGPSRTSAAPAPGAPPNALAQPQGATTPAIGDQVAPPTPTSQQPTQQSQARTPGERVSRLAAIHQAMRKQGKDPMSDPKVKAATEAFLQSYPEARADFDKVMGAGGPVEQPAADAGAVPAPEMGAQATMPQGITYVEGAGWQFIENGVTRGPKDDAERQYLLDIQKQEGSGGPSTVGDAVARDINALAARIPGGGRGPKGNAIEGGRPENASVTPWTTAPPPKKEEVKKEKEGGYESTGDFRKDVTAYYQAKRKGKQALADQIKAVIQEKYPEMNFG